MISARLALLAGRQAAQAAYWALVRRNGVSTYYLAHTESPGAKPSFYIQDTRLFELRTISLHKYGNYHILNILESLASYLEVGEQSHCTHQGGLAINIWSKIHKSIANSADHYDFGPKTLTYHNEDTLLVCYKNYRYFEVPIWPLAEAT